MRLRLKHLIAGLLSLFLVAGLSAQVTTQVFSMQADMPPNLQSAGANPVGATGVTDLYYWIAVHFPGGIRMPFGPVIARRTVGAAALTPVNYVALSWTAVAGASGYSVIRQNALSPFQTTFTCTACVVSSAGAAASFNDTGGAVVNWPPAGAVFVGATKHQSIINNRDEAVPYFTWDVNGFPGRLVYTTTYGGTAPTTPLSGILSLTAPAGGSTGININAPSTQAVPLIDMHADTSTEFRIGAHGAGVSVTETIRASRGTFAVPVVVQNGDTIGSYIFRGYDGVAYQPLASIRAGVDAAPGAGDMPGHLVFSTTADGAAAVTEHLRIANSGIITASIPQLIQTADTTTEFSLRAHGPGNQPLFTTQVSRGTTAAPVIVVAGEVLGDFRFYGYDGAAYQPAAAIRFGVEPAPAAPGAGDMPGNIVFYTSLDGTVIPIEHLRIGNAGAITATSGLVNVTNDAASEVMLETHGAGVSGTQSIMGSRGTRAAPVIVNNADVLGNLLFRGYDGAAYQPAASIVSGVDAAPGAGDMPGSLVFSTTPDGAAAVVERLRISNAGVITATSGQMVVNNDAASDFRVSAHGAGVVPSITYQSSRGTTAAPVIVNNADVIAQYLFQGYDGAAYQPAASITVGIDAAPGAGDMPGNLVFSITPDAAAAVVERLRISNAGIITATSAQVIVTNDAASSVQLEAHGAGVSGTNDIRASRGTRAAPVIVNNADVLGNLVFRGYDGAAYQPAASIVSAVDAAPGAGDMPGSLVFSTTPDAAAAVVERLRISNAGVITATTTQAIMTADAAADARLEVHNDGAAVAVTETIRRSRGTLAAPTIVVNGDTVGSVIFEGSNSNAAPTYLPAASITAVIDAAVAGGGAADMPGRLVFSTTPDAAGAVVERLRIDNAGVFSFNTNQLVVSAVGRATTYGALATAGLGLPPILTAWSALGQIVTIAQADLLALAPAGQYRTSMYIDTTAAAGGACTAQVVLEWTYNAAAMTKNLVAAHDLNVLNGFSDNLTTIAVDAGTDIHRTVTVAGGGCGGAQRFDVYIALERLL